MPAIYNYFGIVNNKIGSDGQIMSDKIEKKIVDLEFKKIINTVLPLISINEKFQRKLNQNLSIMLPEEFDNLRDSAQGRRELAYYSFSQDQVVFNKIKKLLIKIA